MSVNSSEVIDLVQKLGFPIVIALGALWGLYKQNDRFWTHMESRAEKQDQRYEKAAEKQDIVNEKFIDGLNRISSSVEKVASTQDRNLTAFKDAMPQITCRNYKP